MDPRSGNVDPLAAVQDIFRLEGFLSRPAMRLASTGYGLPQENKRAALTLESDRLAAQWKQQSVWLRSEARRWLSPQRQSALDATEANLDSLGERIRRLDKDQGGLQLPELAPIPNSG